jgi:hypothetical protein
VEVEYSQELEAGHVTIHIVDTVAVIVLVHHHHHLKGVITFINSNRTGVTSGTGSANPEFIPVLVGFVLLNP